MSPPTLQASLGEAFTRLKLADYCAGRDELADTVLQGLLFHLDLIVDYRDRGASEADAHAMAVEAFAADLTGLTGVVRVDKGTAPLAVSMELEEAGIAVAWGDDPRSLWRRRPKPFGGSGDP